MNIEVLVSTMNIENEKQYKELLKNINIRGKSIVINQCPSSIPKITDINSIENKFFSFKDKGLSKSRNIAISKSTSDIILLSDDDMTYVDNYKEIVKDAYKKYKDADIIAFYVSSENPNNIKKKLKYGKINFLNSFKIQSVQLSIKLESIKNHEILFDENFGAGTNLYMGEENIFLSDCIKSKLKIYSYPVEIARLSNRESTWFNGYDEKYFQVKGACFYRISKLFWLILSLQFIVRKRNEYKNSITSLKAFSNMIKGKKYKKYYLK